MITIDPRVGSGELAPVLEGLGVPVVVRKLAFGDASFLGKGPDDSTLRIGVERKRITDLLNCITDHRFSGHQLPGLTATYDRVYLVVEGLYRESPQTGMLEVRTGMGWKEYEIGRKFRFKEVAGFLTTMEELVGLRNVTTQSPNSTARFIAHIFAWWGKRYEAHHAHRAFYSPHRPTLTKPSITASMVEKVPGLGWSRATALAAKFGSIDRLVEASVSQIGDSVAGIGPVLARRIYNSLRGEK